MPEGPALHRVARAQHAALAGHRVAVSSPQGRFAAESARLDGRRLERVEAFGKHLFYRFDGDDVVYVHLGLGGKFFTHPVPPPEPTRNVRMRIVGPREAFDLVGPPRCQLVPAAVADAKIAGFGPDPLRGDGPSAFFDAVRRRRKPIGALLLDASVISGVGNVLRAEALWEAKVRPTRLGVDVTDAELRVIWEALVRMMEDAVARGRILPDLPRGADPASIPEIETRRVYKRERCKACGTAVEHPEIGSRTAWFCPRCQG